MASERAGGAGAVDGGDEAGRSQLRVEPVVTVPAHAGVAPPAPGARIVLRLCGNLGSVPSVDWWQRLGSDPELARGYPGGDELERLLAARHAVAVDRIALGAGADEVLDRICRAVLGPGRTAVLPVPTFEMLERYARLAGGDVAPVPWTAGPWPRRAVLDAIGPATALVAIVSPNNPTGLCATAADLDAVAAAAPHALVLVDAAYAEYADEDLGAAALRWPNAVLVRTFSKAFGLAGLRVGYADAHPEVARWLRVTGSPFTCGRLARAAAAARLRDDRAEVDAHVETVRRHRAELERLLGELGARPLPSQANFVFARARDPELLRDLLAGLGVSVRAFAFAGLRELAGGVRISVPALAEQMPRLRAALRCALAPQAIVLDLDGVLADIEGRRPLASADDIAALAARRPLAVVTGCPARLANSVLLRHGFLPHVRAVVAAEDGPGKPDPRPVQLALERLGVANAWMLGDNVVDVEAATAAGIAAFAIEPSGADAAARRQRLCAAGAVRLLAGPRDLLSLLPAR